MDKIKWLDKIDNNQSYNLRTTAKKMQITTPKKRPNPSTHIPHPLPTSLARSGSMFRKQHQYLTSLMPSTGNPILPVSSTGFSAADRSGGGNMQELKVSEWRSQQQEWEHERGGKGRSMGSVGRNVVTRLERDGGRGLGGWFGEVGIGSVGWCDMVQLVGNQRKRGRVGQQRVTRNKNPYIQQQNSLLVQQYTIPNTPNFTLHPTQYFLTINPIPSQIYHLYNTTTPTPSTTPTPPTPNFIQGYLKSIHTLYYSIGKVLVLCKPGGPCSRREGIGAWVGMEMGGGNREGNGEGWVEIGLEDVLYGVVESGVRLGEFYRWVDQHVKISDHTNYTNTQILIMCHPNHIHLYTPTPIPPHTTKYNLQHSKPPHPLTKLNLKYFLPGCGMPRHVLLIRGNFVYPLDEGAGGKLGVIGVRGRGVGCEGRGSRGVFVLGRGRDRGVCWNEKYGNLGQNSRYNKSKKNQPCNISQYLRTKLLSTLLPHPPTLTPQSFLQSLTQSLCLQTNLYKLQTCSHSNLIVAMFQVQPKQNVFAIGLLGGKGIEGAFRRVLRVYVGFGFGLGDQGSQGGWRDIQYEGKQYYMLNFNIKPCSHLEEQSSKSSRTDNQSTCCCCVLVLLHNKIYNRIQEYEYTIRYTEDKNRSNQSIRVIQRPTLILDLQTQQNSQTNSIIPTYSASQNIHQHTPVSLVPLQSHPNSLPSQKNYLIISQPQPQHNKHNPTAFSFPSHPNATEEYLYGDPDHILYATDLGVSALWKVGYVDWVYSLVRMMVGEDEDGWDWDDGVGNGRVIEEKLAGIGMYLLKQTIDVYGCDGSTGSSPLPIHQCIFKLLSALLTICCRSAEDKPLTVYSYSYSCPQQGYFQDENQCLSYSQQQQQGSSGNQKRNQGKEVCRLSVESLAVPEREIEVIAFNLVVYLSGSLGEQLSKYLSQEQALQIVQQISKQPNPDPVPPPHSPSLNIFQKIQLCNPCLSQLKSQHLHEQILQHIYESCIYVCISDILKPIWNARIGGIGNGECERIMDKFEVLEEILGSVRGNVKLDGLFGSVQDAEDGGVGFCKSVQNEYICSSNSTLPQTSHKPKQHSTPIRTPSNRKKSHFQSFKQDICQLLTVFKIISSTASPPLDLTFQQAFAKSPAFYEPYLFQAFINDFDRDLLREWKRIMPYFMNQGYFQKIFNDDKGKGLKQNKNGVQSQKVKFVYMPLSFWLEIFTNILGIGNKRKILNRLTKSLSQYDFISQQDYNCLLQSKKPKINYIKNPQPTNMSARPSKVLIFPQYFLKYLLNYKYIQINDLRLCYELQEHEKEYQRGKSHGYGPRSLIDVKTQRIQKIQRIQRFSQVKQPQYSICHDLYTSNRYSINQSGKNIPKPTKSDNPYNQPQPFTPNQRQKTQLSELDKTKYQIKRHESGDQSQQRSEHQANQSKFDPNQGDNPRLKENEMNLMEIMGRLE